MMTFYKIFTFDENTSSFFFIYALDSFIERPLGMGTSQGGQYDLYVILISESLRTYISSIKDNQRHLV